MNILHLDLSGIFSFTVSPLELVLRGTLMYWFLFIVFRFILRRDVGSLGISDFLFVVILGDAAQNGMIGSATSATDGMVLIGTLVFWSYMLDFMSFRFPVIQRIRQEGVEGIATVKRMYLEADGEMSLIRQDEARAPA